METHIFKEGQQYGPYTAEQIDQLLAEGNINLDDLAYQEGMKDWQPLRGLRQLPLQPVNLPPSPLISLWNPNAAVNWSLLFTPVFGSILVWKNWEALGDAKKTIWAKRWAIASIILCLVALAVSDKPAKTLIYVLLIPWYIIVARPQAKFIQNDLQARYRKLLAKTDRHRSRSTHRMGGGTEWCPVNISSKL